MNRTFVFTLSAVMFFVAALVHLVSFVTGSPIMIGAATTAPWVNILALFLAGYLFVEMVQEVIKSKKKQ